ncbi:hypothetical protein EC957_000801 [Mortierella hygrophila]|uniref:Uncharacterized protein n=1 Tax=Mortierella hygrophila TaxID=979708 RepID=A0A9P6K2Q8_9FUNG|nr:hypothetical protein EC957_000801 [Mortierella hygrophila]
MEVLHLVGFHVIGTNLQRDHPSIFVDDEDYFTAKYIETRENVEEQHYYSYVVKLLMGMTTFKEIAEEYDTYGDDSSDEE